MKKAKQLLETYLAALSVGEMEKAIAPFAGDGAIEFPYFCDTVEVARAIFPNGVKDLVQQD